ncbi:MAG: GIY-YIG nuclease family protein [Lachnospiraceae bacterium]|nr:GIY-YIG nuclease family protein [Lachnospiraceae bacterium]
MAKGIIYIMTSVVPGLIKIGKTDNFESRMYNLEHNGYCNVTGLKRTFAIEVDDYAEKEIMLHTIFDKSRLQDTELFALDVNIAVQLLSSFDGTVIYPKTETKADIFESATDNGQGKLVPNGIYTFEKKKKSDNNKLVKAKAEVRNGCWIIKKGSILGVTEDAGVSSKARKARTDMQINKSGRLLEDYDLGCCSPSFAGNVVMNQSINGWTDWKNDKGQPVDIYREKKAE